MNIEYKDFVGVFSNVYPDGFCEHLINEFNRNQKLGAGNTRQNSEDSPKHQKNDYHIFSNGKNINFEPFNEHTTIDMFFKGLQACFEQYSNEYSVLRNVKTHCSNMKMQKTSSGGGYHVWHCEQGNGQDASRALVYMLYLNTISSECNGETEFLYQQRRINPIENTMILWPAGFTHTHSGNPVYGKEIKYVVTGWFFNE